MNRGRGQQRKAGTQRGTWTTSRMPSRAVLTTASASVRSVAILLPSARRHQIAIGEQGTEVQWADMARGGSSRRLIRCGSCHLPLHLVKERLDDIEEWLRALHEEKVPMLLVLLVEELVVREPQPHAPLKHNNLLQRKPVSRQAGGWAVSGRRCPWDMARLRG